MDNINVVFHHMPKCAGSSLKTGINIICNRSHKIFKYLPHKQLNSEMIDTIKSCYKITNCRHPYSRLISAYNFYISHKDSVINDEITLKRFYYYKNNAKIFYNNYKTDINAFIQDIEIQLSLKYNVGLIHFQPLTNLISDISFYDYVVRYEHIDEDFELLCNKFDLYNSIKLLKNNSSKKYVYEEEITDKSKQIIHEIYKKDFEVFNYKQY